MLSENCPTMNISLLQLDIQWMDVEENISRAEALASSLKETDLIVLPEMWATGFTTQPNSEVHISSVRALHWMRQTAHSLRCAVAGTLAVDRSLLNSEHFTKEDWRNRFYFVTPEGEMRYYDKCHLFAPGGEDKVFQAGHERTIVIYKGVRFLLQTCFDLRFPESSRNALAAPYDVLLYAASWPEKRIAAWNALLQARAIENQALCVGVNRTGKDPLANYNGNSSAYDANGTCLVTSEAKECVCTIVWDKEKQNNLRKRFPVLV